MTDTDTKLARPSVIATGSAALLNGSNACNARASLPTSPKTGTLAGYWHGLRNSPRKINLALQGAGAHGAFTWGVLDELLKDTRMHFEGLSGSSAGAMNAVALADGCIKGGREGARQALADSGPRWASRCPWAW